MTLPAALMPWIERQFFLADGVTPNRGGFIYSYEAGTSTPQDTFTDSDLSVANSNPIELDADGRMPITYLIANGYKFVVCDSTQNPLLPPSAIVYTIDDVEDVGFVFFSTLGAQQADGAKDQTDGYAVVNTDMLVTMTDNVAVSAVVNLPAAADRTGLPLIVKNLGTSTVEVTPNGSETIDGVAAAYVLPAFSSPNAPTIELVPTTGGWFIVASHLA